MDKVERFLTIMEMYLTWLLSKISLVGRKFWKNRYEEAKKELKNK